MNCTSRRLVVAWLAITLLSAAVPGSAAAIEADLLTPVVPLYGRAEIAVAEVPAVENPDDPRQIVVTGTFTSSSGRTITMPGFRYQDFQYRDDGLVARGTPEWRVRFCPTEAGPWEGRIRVVQPSRRLESGPIHVQVTPADARGFLRRSESNPLALEFENGQPLIAIGSNVFPRTCLGQPQGADRGRDVIRYLERTARAGGNFCRLRMDSWFIPLESSPDEATGYLGGGRYDPQSAWEVDQIVEAAERLDITLMLCVSNANAHVNEPSEPNRKRYNFYHQDYGGPLEDMAGFWTDAEVRRLFVQKMRYSVARWGYSPAIGVWEFFNEVQITPERGEAMARWHHDLARQWKELDPYRRPVTTSPVGGFRDVEEWWRLFDCPSIDLVQYHTYQFLDLAQGIAAVNDEILAMQHDSLHEVKPFMVGEFGTQRAFREREGGSVGSDAKIDPTGLHIHNGIWASVFSGSVGGLPWFISNHIDPLDLYGCYTGLSNFSRDSRINEHPWKPIAAVCIASQDDLGENLYGVLDLPSTETFSTRETEIHTVGRDGTIAETQAVNGYLFGLRAHANLRRPPLFDVDYPVDGQFIITVDHVVGKTNMPTPVIVELDGMEVARREFVVGKGLGKAAEYKEQYDNWLVYFDEPIAVDVPAGRHRIRVAAEGFDRVAVSYRLRPYADRSRTIYRALAMAGGEEIRMWVQNARNTYARRYHGEGPESAPTAEIVTQVSRPGTYRVQWWDTEKGVPLGSETVQSSEDGVLRFGFAGTLSDQACTIQCLD